VILGATTAGLRECVRMFPERAGASAARTLPVRGSRRFSVPENPTVLCGHSADGARQGGCQLRASLAQSNSETFAVELAGTDDRDRASLCCLLERCQRLDACSYEVAVPLRRALERRIETRLRWVGRVAVREDMRGVVDDAEYQARANSASSPPR
jgi:hypothetical protein